MHSVAARQVSRATLSAALTGELVEIPNTGGYDMTATAEGRCLVVTAWRAATPLVTVGIAAHSRCSARLWRLLHDGYPALPTAEQSPPPVPWVAARVEVGLMQHMSAAPWLGDWERCIGWAWIEQES